MTHDMRHGSWRENASLPQGADELYAYDGVNQLVDVQRGVLNSAHTSLDTKNFQQEWWLDATGNWSAFLEDSDGNGTWDISQARLHNAANELLSMSDPLLDLAHDRAGNMTVVPSSESLIPNPQSLVYDAWNRLVRVSSGEVTIAEYEYDGLSRRIQKRTPNGSSVATIRDFYYSASWQVLEEYVRDEGSESLLDQRFCWGIRYIDDLVFREYGEDLGGVLQWRLFAMQDANRNVIAAAGWTGVIHERYRYDAYGAPIYLYPDGTVNPSGSAYAWPVLFTGRHLDPDTNLYHYRFRDYHHLLGRFVTRDPIGYRGGVSLYGYVGNNPWNKTDPTGLWSWTRTFGVIRAVGGAFETAAGASLAFAGGVAVASGVGAPLGVAMVAGGVLVAAHGVDTAQAGVRQAATDTHVDSLTSTGLQAAGMSQGTANLVDAGISVAGSLGAGAVSATTKVAAVAGTEEAAGMTTMQVICKIEKGSKALPDSAYKALGGASTSALSKAAQMEQGVVQGTEGINVLKSVQLAPTGLTPFGDAGAGVFGAAGGATSAYDTNTRDQSR